MKRRGGNLVGCTDNWISIRFKVLRREYPMTESLSSKRSSSRVRTTDCKVVAVSIILPQEVIGKISHSFFNSCQRISSQRSYVTRSDLMGTYVNIKKKSS